MDLINKKEASRIILVNPSRRDMLETLDKTHDVFDGMTNGEVMKALFPYIEVSTYGVVTSVKGLDCNKGALDPYRHFWSEWWNAPYKTESEDKEC